MKTIKNCPLKGTTTSNKLLSIVTLIALSLGTIFVDLSLALPMPTVPNPFMAATSAVYMYYDFNDPNGGYSETGEYRIRHWHSGLHSWYDGFAYYNSDIFSIPEFLDSDRDGYVSMNIISSVVNTFSFNNENCSVTPPLEAGGSVLWEVSSSDFFGTREVGDGLFIFKVGQLYDIQGHIGISAPIPLDYYLPVIDESQDAHIYITHTITSTLKITPVPEPSSILLVLVGIAWYVRHKRV